MLLIESLETRSLLSFSANVNFQPDGVAVPTGYRVDTGASYSRRANGLTYGWSGDNRDSARDRNVHSQQEYDTFNHMQRSGNLKWEIAVPNAVYRVRVVAGDASYIDSVFRITAEGNLLINKTPTSGERFISREMEVSVRDGKLTLDNGSGAKNNKLNFVQIRHVRELSPSEPQPPVVSAWSRGADMPVALGEVAGGVINNKMYIIGDGGGQTLSFDLSTKKWSSNLAQRAHRAKDQVAEVVNGKLYVFGGIRYVSGGRQFFNYTQIFNPATNSWSLGAAMPFAAAAPQTAVIGGQIYVAGGITTGNVTTNRVARYNPSNNTWTNLATMPGVGRNSAPAGTDGSKLYIFGGRVGGDSPENGRTDILVYNPSSNSWSTLPQTLPIGRGGTVKAPFVNGEFYLIGGETSTAPIGRVDIFRPTTGAFRRGPDMLTPRHGIYPIFSNDRIHVAGGGETSGLSYSRKYELLSL